MTVLTVAPTEIYESGDSALRVVAISQANEDNWLTVHRLADWLESCGAEGLYGAVPTYDSVLVEFDPILVSARQVRAFVKLGLLELGLGPAVLVVVGYVVINLAFDYILQPRIMATDLDISPVVVIVAILVWTAIIGPVGALAVGAALLAGTVSEPEGVGVAANRSRRRRRCAMRLSIRADSSRMSNGFVR